MTKFMDGTFTTDFCVFFFFVGIKTGERRIVALTGSEARKTLTKGSRLLGELQDAKSCDTSELQERINSLSTSKNIWNYLELFCAEWRIKNNIKHIFIFIHFHSSQVHNTVEVQNSHRTLWMLWTPSFFLSWYMLTVTLALETVLSLISCGNRMYVRQWTAEDNVQAL